MAVLWALGPVKILLIWERMKSSNAFSCDTMQTDSPPWQADRHCGTMQTDSPPWQADIQVNMLHIAAAAAAAVLKWLSPGRCRGR